MMGLRRLQDWLNPPDSEGWYPNGRRYRSNWAAFKSRFVLRFVPGVFLHSWHYDEHDHLYRTHPITRPFLRVLHWKWRRDINKYLKDSSVK